MTKQEKVFAIQMLSRVIARFEDQSFHTGGDGLTYRQWFYSVEAALGIVSEALIAVTRATVTKTPIEKATEVYETLHGNIVVIDMARAEYETVKSLIADEDVQSLVPFQTAMVHGENFIHIQNESSYAVETKYHTIRKGETLCKDSHQTWYVTARDTTPTCPGCLAKAKGIVATYLLNR
jgi:hypothetical protein